MTIPPHPNSSPPRRAFRPWAPWAAWAATLGVLLLPMAAWLAGLFAPALPPPPGFLPFAGPDSTAPTEVAATAAVRPDGSASAWTKAAAADAHFELSTPLIEALSARPALWGAPLRPEQLRRRVVLVTFFASWCVPCRSELEALRALSAREGEAVQVLAVNLFETFDGLSDERRLSAFLKRMALPFPAIRGSEGLAQTFGGVERIPTLLVFDRGGRLVRAFRSAGPQSAIPEPAALGRLVAALR